MSDKDDQLLQRLLPIFKEEAREHIAVMSEKLAVLEQAAEDIQPAIVELVFREAHSLKAAARAVSQYEIEVICQSVESIFSALKRGDIAVTSGLAGILLRATDALDDFLAAMDGGPMPNQRNRAMDLSKALDAALAAAPATPSPPVDPPSGVMLGFDIEEPEPPPAPDPTPAPVLSRVEERRASDPVEAASVAVAAPDTVRLSVQRLDGLQLQAEEMLSEKLAAGQLASELKDVLTQFAEWREEYGRARGATLNADPAVRRFLDWNETQLHVLETRLASVGKEASADARGLGTKIDRLLFDMKQILTLPCGSMLQLIPRVVREIARDQGKDVGLVMAGGDVEIDRHILEELKDPLLHIVRNCVDHGIETPQTRLAAGKQAHAEITIGVRATEGDKVEFVITDDGGGISTRKLAATAVKLGLLAPDRVDADDAELLPLIFQSGVSTSPMITDLSGRGLGLAIVREKVERLGGTISVDSRLGHGTIFRLVVPLTLATYRGIRIRVGDRIFVLPTLNVERVVGVDRTAVSTVENRYVINVGGAPLSLVRLRDVLELPPAPASEPGHGRLTAVVLGVAPNRVAFEVDAVEGDQEIVVKSLGKPLVRVRNVQGGAILASGAIAPILNVADLLKSARRIGQSAIATEQAASFVAERKNILIAEDSITARGLLKNILEAAGYRVKTAVDGMDAWATLNLEAFDVLVSDVEMPRMDGFELTARIRADKSLAALPVVLVTALDSREDRERGVDVGANAYILKGGFEQGSLLEAVRRLA